MAVNHPEMSLFRGLNEAPTTKGGPACSRTACPPAPDVHNSFIQEPHVHTKAPEINPTSRHPGQCPESSQNPRLKRGDSIQGRSNRRPATKSQHEKKHFFLFFFFFLRGGLGEAGGHSTLRARCLCWAHTARPPLGKGGVGPSFEWSWCQCFCKGRVHNTGQPGHNATWPRGFVQQWPV